MTNWKPATVGQAQEEERIPPRRPELPHAACSPTPERSVATLGKIDYVDRSGRGSIGALRGSDQHAADGTTHLTMVK